MPIPEHSEPVAVGETTTLSDAVFHRLLAAIQQGALVPGENLRDKEIAQWLGVSRTPVREAITHLVRLGMVESAPSRYTRVTAVTKDVVQQTLEVTGYNAGIAMRIAVGNMSADEREIACRFLDEMIVFSDESEADLLFTKSRELYSYLTKFINNQLFISNFRDLGVIAARNLYGHAPENDPSRERSQQYAQLQQAIRSKDADAAESLVRIQHHL